MREIVDSQYAKSVGVLKAFCDENRLRILEMLKSGEKCACKLLEELDITQPTLSHHMKILVDSGIICARKKGKWTYYSCSPEGVEAARNILRTLTETIDNCGCGRE